MDGPSGFATQEAWGERAHPSPGRVGDLCLPTGSRRQAAGRDGGLRLPPWPETGSPSASQQFGPVTPGFSHTPHVLGGTVCSNMASLILVSLDL
jgi:hypothetical protein